MECRPGGSLRLDAREPDHLRPLLRFVGDELSKIVGRARKHSAAQVGKPRLHLGILVEIVDDLGGRTWATETKPTKRESVRDYIDETYQSHITYRRLLEQSVSMCARRSDEHELFQPLQLVDHLLDHAE